MLILKNKKVC